MDHGETKAHDVHRPAPHGVAPRGAESSARRARPGRRRVDVRRRLLPSLVAGAGNVTIDCESSVRPRRRRLILPVGLDGDGRLREGVEVAALA